MTGASDGCPMTFEFVAELEDEARRLRSTGQIPSGFEAELSASFEAAAEASLAAAEQPRRTAASLLGYRDPAGARRSQGDILADVRARASSVARRRLGPPARRLERRSELGAARAADALSTQAHVALDHLERVASRSPVVSRTLAAVRPGGADTSAVGTLTPAIEGPLLAWVLERLVDSASGATEEAEAVPALVLHVECGDGRVVEALAARGLEARGADPRRSARSSGGTNIVAAGALECLGATPNDTLDGLLISGVVDRLRPGAARASAQFGLGPALPRGRRRDRERTARGCLRHRPGRGGSGRRPAASPRDVVPSPRSLRTLGSGGVRPRPERARRLRRLRAPSRGGVDVRRGRPMRTRPVRIDQVIPSIVERDAVSHHTLESQRVLRSMGFVSEIYACTMGRELTGRVHPLRELPRERGGHQWVCYQASIGSPAADAFATHPGLKLLNYHNISPAEPSDRWMPVLGDEVRLGRKQLVEPHRWWSSASPSPSSIGRSSRRPGTAARRWPRSCSTPRISTAPRTRGRPVASPPAAPAGVRDWLFVGQMLPHKAHEDVIKALACAGGCSTPTPVFT